MFTRSISQLDPIFQPAFRELLSPFVSAVGFSTLVQSRSLQMHQQVENRLKLLYDIQVESLRHFEAVDDDFYCDGLKLTKQASIDFLTLSLALAEEIQDVEDVRAQLDINNTIDHVPHGDGEWWLFHDESVSTYWRKLVTARPLKDIRECYTSLGIPLPLPARKDEASIYLEKTTMMSRRALTVQRILNAMRLGHQNGHFFVFDTLTLSDDRLGAFYSNPNALRDHFRSVGRSVLEAEGRKMTESFEDCFQYFCVPEYGATTGRLHFHIVYIMRTTNISATIQHPPQSHYVQPEPHSLRLFRQIFA